MTRNHAQLIRVGPEYILPEHVCGLELAHGSIQDGNERRGESPVEIGMSEHRPSVSATHAHLGDSPTRACRHAPLVCMTTHILRGVIGLVDVVLEGVLLEVVIRRAHVGVVQAISHKPERVVVVPRGVLWVYLDMNAKLACKVEEVLLLIANHNGNVSDARLLELANLALDKDLAANSEEALGLLVGDGGKARGEASGHDDGVSHLVGLERLKAIDAKKPVLD